MGLLAVAIAASPEGIAQERQEVTLSRSAALFLRMDVNRNGRVEKSEFCATLPDTVRASADLLWAMFDPGNKGSITLADYLTTPPVLPPLP